MTTELGNMNPTLEGGGDIAPPSYNPATIDQMLKPSEISINPNSACGIVMNPRVFFMSVAVIWGFIIWGVVDSDGCSTWTGEVQGYITSQLGWVYVGSLCAFQVTMFYLAFSKYGNIRLAKDENEKPDFSTATWFSMLFSAGVGIGLFFWGVAEPVLHYGWVSRLNHNYMQECTDNNTASSCFTVESRHARALLGMNVSWYHWGFGASATYVTVALPLAYYHYRHRKDLTMRTALYPLIGNRIYGWIGDLTEVLAIIGTMFGVCTSLGLGVKQIGAGLKRMNNEITLEDGGPTQLWIIWVITITATVSVVTGLEVGIRRISEVTFIVGIIVLAMLFFLDNTWFLLAFFTEMIGFHLNHLFEISFASMGFEIWTESHGADLINTGGYDWAYDWLTLDYWAGNWTIFYWAWWISWAPFVGLFIARISRGRTIREFIIGNMVVPTLLTCIWLTVFGGAGIHQQIQAENAGMTCSDCYTDPPDVWVNGTYGTNGTWINGTYVNGTATYINGCQLLICRGWNAEEMLFDLVELYPLSNFMTLLSTVGLVLYFVTSSDSASSVMDQMASNGKAEGPIWQRVFWAFTEGATAHVVLTTGGSSALKALRSISIIAALPFCILMIIMLWTFVRFLVAENDPAFNEKMMSKRDWNINIFDAWARVLTCGLCTDDKCVDTCTAWWLSPLLQCRAQAKVGNNNALWMFWFAVSFVVLVTFSICADVGMTGGAPLKACAWMVWVCIGVANRMKIRESQNIAGTCIGDVLTYVMCGPIAVYQEFRAVLDGQTRPWGIENGVNAVKEGTEAGVNLVEEAGLNYGETM